MAFTDAEIERHNELYRRACSLIRRHILIDGEVRFARPGWLAKWRLRKGIALFHRALRINPNSWQNRFWIAKALQRLGDHRQAISWFSDALRVDPANSSIAKEAANEALQLGDNQLALALVRPAAEQNPDDPALQHNLGLALLLSGKLQEAHQTFSRAAALQSDPLTARLLELTEQVLRGERACPQTLDDVQRNA
jgi:tetratricopeptide (TPR) repeat protein